MMNQSTHTRVSTSILIALLWLTFSPFAHAEDRLETLRHQLDTGTPAERANAARRLSEMGEKAQPAVFNLREALRASEIPVRIAAAEALGAIGPASPDNENALLFALVDQDGAVRQAAYAALHRLDINISVDVLNAIETVYGNDAWEGFIALRELVDLGPNVRGTIHAVIAALDAHFTLTRRYAAWTLGDWWEHAVIAVPALDKALDDPARNVRIAAAKALGEIARRDPDAMMVLVRAVDDDNWMVRNMAISMLGYLGPKAEPAALYIVPHLDDENEVIRYSAELALDDIIPDADKRATLLSLQDQ